MPLTTWADSLDSAITETRAVNQRKPTKRLTADDLGIMLRMRADNCTQAQIAQRLNCDVAAVNRWLRKLTDTAELAKSILRGNAARMAENIVKKGRAADHIKVLEGINVLSPTVSAGLTIQIGIKAQDVSVELQAPSDAKANVPRNELTE